MAIGEAFLSASLQVLFEKLASQAISELGKVYGVKVEVVKLQKTLNRLRVMLHDAESKKTAGEQFPLRLRELKLVACEAEDVVDEFRYEDLRRKVKHTSEGRRGPYCKSLLSPRRKLGKFCSCLAPRTLSFRYKMARRIEDIRRKLDDISKDKKDLDISEPLVVGVTRPEFKGQIKETGALLPDPEVFGRDKVKKELIDLLLAATDVGSTTSSSAAAAAAASHPTGLSVLSIVGMGGLGKTTLARLVYNTEEVQEHFHLKMWVFVSQDFDLKRLTKEILEHVDPQPNLQNTNNLNVLQQNLLQRLKGKRFLLILDDLWEEDYKKWGEFSAPLILGGKGSKVLITTRNASVAEMVRSVKMIKLGDLSFEDCWMIFKKFAFPDANSDSHPDLESNGKKIVEKLKGNPLAATTVGGLLRIEFEERKWRYVLESELWELEQVEEGIIPALRLSFEYLPPHLKQCFAYCAVFPKGYRFNVLVLVQLWMAQGYVQPQEKKPVEDVGRDYLNELCKRSLIQFLDDDDKYVIHDLLHDLGQLILQDDFCQIRPNQLPEIPEDAHSKLHLRIHYAEPFRGELDVLCKCRSLRTLLFWPVDLIYTQVPHNLFHRVKCLRVLDLSFSAIDTLPESIGCLKHLRYIDLSKTNIQSLPDSFCALLNLQTLRLGGCDTLSKLPSDMSHLINLHYLEAKGELVSKIAKIGKLVHLQNLEVFSISEENGNRIGDLKNMKELRGKLCIQNLERVKTREEASEANFKKMQYLEELEMEWAGDCNVGQINTHLEESIIEGLQPPPHLKGLIVKCYAGINFPSWMNHNSISILESIHLHRCRNLKSLRPVGQMPFLKTLGVTGCPELEELPSLPTTLESLILQDTRLHSLPNSLDHLPLQKILICKISELKKLPLLPTTLKELTVEDIGLEAIPEFSQCHGLSAPTTSEAGNITDVGSSDNRKPMLSILKIHGCPHLTSLHEGLLNHHLRHLRVLSIKDCKKLESWPEGEGFLATLSSLDKELSIENCPKLNALPEGSKLHPSLKKLAVKGCPEVPNRSIFSQVHEFDSYGICIEKPYRSLAHCAEEALGEILALDSLEITYLQEDDGLGASTIERQGSPPESSPPPVFFMYNIEDLLDWEFMRSSMHRHVKLVIKVGRRGRGQRSADDDAIDDGAIVDEDYESKLLCMCLRGHPWTSSLCLLELDGIPDAAFTGVVDQHIHHRNGGLGEEGEAPLHHPLHLPSLLSLLLRNCRLPTKTLLPHLTALKMMSIFNSPRLRLSSVEVGIRSVPSLKTLWIGHCPDLLTSLASNPLLKNNCDGDSEEDATLSAAAAPPAPPRPPPLPLLKTLIVDNLQLLTWLQGSNSHPGHPTTDSNDSGRPLRDHLVTSLRSLWIMFFQLTSFTAEAEEGLRTLASSLQQLFLCFCPNLENLPADLKGLLPNLKFLLIEKCPGIRCLPDRGLPDSLECLSISECPELAKRCRPAGKDDGDWGKIAHVPVVIVDEVLLNGSYSKFQEAALTWDFISPELKFKIGLECLYISGCPELAKRCRPGGKHDGDWGKIARVPLVKVDEVLLNGSNSKFQEAALTWDFRPPF